MEILDINSVKNLLTALETHRDKYSYQIELRTILKYKKQQRGVDTFEGHISKGGITRLVNIGREINNNGGNDEIRRKETQ